MAKYYVLTSGFDRTIDAADWNVVGEMLIFYGTCGHKVLAVRADSVKEISLQPEQK